MYTLLNRPDVFKAYIAVSPSLWWDDQALAKQAEEFVADRKELQAALYMTMGNEGGSMLGSAQKVIGSFANSSGRIDAEFQRWPQESHGSIVMRSVYAGMEWLHEFYHIHEPARVYEESGLDFFDKRFAHISEYLGYEVKIPEHALMEIQNHLSEMKRQVEAQNDLHRILELYPNSANAHYDLGRSYLETNDTVRAEEKLRRALELYPGNSGARTALEKLALNPTTIVMDVMPSIAVLRGYVGEYRYSDEISNVTFEDRKLFIKVRNDKRELRPRANASFYAVDLDREYIFRKKAGKTVQ